MPTTRRNRLVVILHEDLLELTTQDLFEDPPAEQKPKRGLPRPTSGISVTAAAPAASPPPAAPSDRPRFVPSAVSRPIRERSRKSAGPDVKSSTDNASKARGLFDEALQAEEAGDRPAALRHVKLALAFDPNEPRYQALLEKLKRP